MKQMRQFSKVVAKSRF